MSEPGQRWHYRRSLASRITLLTTLAVGLSVAFVAAGAFVTARQQLQAQLDESLLERANAAVAAGFIGPSTSSPASDVEVLVLDAADRRYTGLDPEYRVAAGEIGSSLRTTVRDGVEYRIVAVPTLRTEGRALVIAQSLRQQEALLRRIGLVCLLFGLVGAAGAGVAGWGVARNGLRPVRRLTASVEHIARTEDLRTPLPLEGDDEIARLASAFNQMLQALDISRERQRQLVADAGHELRTPLTSLRTNVDLLMQVDSSGRAIDPAARGELLDDIRAQIDELTTLIGDLTELARDEPLTPVIAEVDLAMVIEDSVARVRRRAPDVSFDVVAAPWTVVGEAAALERAVTNLLDNAAKWSPTGGTVRVRLDGGVLVVDDEGPGIAPGARERVFDRFWRAEESRTMPGSGLGLAIVRQVAQRHSGSVHADAAPGGGARLVLQLPGAPVREEESV
ncbi:ATP-binding protein [Nocardioides sp.]|uniref:HAMP domain-containing sensor histidine kinase n=1 Tax=Nocardioides sp. TaxID=35761 RepID=UPI0035188689